MTTSEQLQFGRAKNATLAFLERRISVPKIYIDAVWDGHPIDVLAIDRDGVGDVHAVLLFARRYTSDGRLDLPEQESTVGRLIDLFTSIPANYKYIAAVDVENSHFMAKFTINSVDRLFSPDGIGRIGLLHINAATEEEPEMELRLRPERFRARIAKLADEYIEQHTADWEIRA